MSFSVKLWSKSQIEFLLEQQFVYNSNTCSNWNFLYVLICCVRDSFQIPLCWWITMSDRFIYSSPLVYLGILKTNTMYLSMRIFINRNMITKVPLNFYSRCLNPRFKKITLLAARVSKMSGRGSRARHMHVMSLNLLTSRTSPLRALYL